MKKSTKILIPLLCITPLFSALSACGGNAPQADVTFEFWHTFGQKNLESLQKKVDQFKEVIKKRENKTVEITLAYQGGYDDIKYNISHGFAGGNVPTIGIAYPDHVADYLEVENGKYVYDLSSYANDAEIGFSKQSDLGDKHGADDFVKSFYDEGKQYAKEGIYSLPYMKSSEIMFYNQEALLTAAKDYSVTSKMSSSQVVKWISEVSWEDFVAFGNAIVGNLKAGKYGNKMKEVAYYDSDSNLFISQMFQKEIPYSSIVNGKGHIDWESGENNTKSKAMVSELKQNYTDGLIKTKGTEGTYGSDSFKNMECIFSIGSSGGTGYNMPEAGVFTVGCCKVPARDDNPLYVSQGPTFTFLKNPSKTDAENDLRMKYAWQFAKFLTNEDANVECCIYGSEGYLPVRTSAYSTEAFQTFLEDGEIYAQAAKVLINDINGSYLNTKVFKGSAALRDEVGGLITQSLKGTKTIDDAFSDAINQAKLKF